MFFFFFSSRRRHTRCSRDWSSDVCSSDLMGRVDAALEGAAQLARVPSHPPAVPREQRDGAEDHHEGDDVGADVREREIGRASCKGKSVDLGGRRIIKKKKKNKRKRESPKT